jgi:hypothetical protein
MEKLRKYHVGDFVLTFVLIMMLVYGCSQKSVNNETFPSVSLSMKVTEPGLLQYVDQFRLIVTAPDMDSINTSLSLEKGYLVGAVEVPAGKARTFTVLALDAASGDTIYRGNTTTDVFAGTAIVLTINLYPQVPLIKLSPRYLNVNANSLCSLDVKVFNDTGLYGISFRIDFDNYVIRPDSAHLGTGLDSNLMFAGWLDYDSGFFACSLSQIDQRTPIVDTNGNATLARIFFQSFVPEAATETAVLSTEVTYLAKIMDSVPVSIPVGQLYADEGIIEVLSSRGDSVVTFRDPRLEYVVRNLLEKYYGDIYRSEVEGITALPADEGGILNLGGLSNLANLQFLELEYNQIRDITEISSLKKLGQLFLGWNNIEDISSLAGLPTLFEVDLRYNQITDIHPLYALYPNNTLGTPTNSTDKVWLLGNPVANIAQVDTLCDLSVAVFLYDPGIDWCSQAY